METPSTVPSNNGNNNQLAIVVEKPTRSGGGKGRKKVEVLKKIEDKNSLIVTFSKRRSGLFKKAKEITKVCKGAEAAVITFSPVGKPYSDGYPSVDSLINRYLNATAGSGNPHQIIKNNDNNSNSAAFSLEHRNGVEDFWWEEPVEEMELEELTMYRDALEELKSNVASRLDDLSNRRAKTMDFLGAPI